MQASTSTTEVKAVSPSSNKFKDITNLVFQGGGVKGIAYVSALEGLMQNGLKMDQIKRVAGASAGAIQAMAICLGYTLTEIKDILGKTNFEEFLNGKFKDEFFALYNNVEAFTKKATDITDAGTSTSGIWGALGLYKSPEVQTIRKGLNIMSEQDFGLFDGEYIREWLEKLIRDATDKNGSKDRIYLTFKELHDLAVGNPIIYKDLYLVSTNTTTGKMRIFCWEKTPDVIISDAVRASMSIPFLFKPHRIHYKNEASGNLPIPEKDGHLYIDGGVVDNYPIWLFDTNKYCEAISAPNGSFQNPATLGLRLVDRTTKLHYESSVSDLADTQLPQKLMAYVLQVVNCFYDQQEIVHQHSENEFRTIFIDHKGISTAEFNLNQFQKDLLLYSGREGVSDFLRRQAHDHSHQPGPERQSLAESGFFSGKKTGSSSPEPTPVTTDNSPQLGIN